MYAQNYVQIEARKIRGSFYDMVAMPLTAHTNSVRTEFHAYQNEIIF